MRSGVANFAVLLLLAGIGPRLSEGQSIGSNEDAARAKILVLENVWNRAEAAGDLKALDALFDTELTYIDSQGALLSKAEFLSYAKSTRLEQIATELIKVQLFDDTAIVNGTYRAKEFKNGKTVVQQGRFTDTWVYKDSNWICIAVQATPILQTLVK
jgi:hypothetical protein